MISRLLRALCGAFATLVILTACGGAHSSLPGLPGSESIPGQAKARVASLATASADLVAIDAGGAAAAGFSADEDFVVGSTWTYSSTKAIKTGGVSNPAPQAVYQTQRTGKTVSYVIPGLTAGTAYTVNLSFCELFWTAVKQRVFNVAINGTNVLSNFDIVAAAGAPYTAVAQSFSAAATTAGTITVTLTAVTDNATVSAIEIAPQTTSPSGATDINAGGGAVGTFLSDADYGPGTYAYTGSGTIDTSLVTNPAPQGVYLTQRVNTVIAYTIPGFTPGAAYSIRLDFAELYFTAPGQRVFNISINNTQVLSNLDIFAATGAKNKALAETFNATASSAGTIAITLTATTNYAVLNGIEITPGSVATPTPTPAPTSTPAFNDWPSYGYDAQRSGYNPNTSGITPASVANLHLGWQTAISGSAQSQPIVLTNVAGHAALLVVAAFANEEAFDGLTGKLVWKTALPTQDVQGCGIAGVSGTAAYDKALSAVFVAAGNGGGAPNHTLIYRLDAATGKITGSVDVTPTLLPGEANYSHSGVAFANGRIYLGTGSDCEGSPTQTYVNWRGRVVSVDPSAMTLLSTFFTTWQVGANPGNYGGGGVWAWGGVSSDANGNVYVATGNAETNAANAPLVATPPFAATNNEQAGLAEHLVQLSGDLSTVEGSNYPGFNFTIGLSDLDYSGTPVVYTPPATSGCGPMVATQGKGGTLVINNTQTLAETASFALSIPSGRQLYSGNPAYSPATGYLYAPITSAGAGSSLLPPGLAAIGGCGTSITWTAQFGQDAAAFSGDTPRTAPTVTSGGVVFMGTPCTPNGTGGCGTPGTPAGALWAVNATTGTVLGGGQPLLVTADALRMAPSADGLWLFLLDQSGNMYGLTVDPAIPAAALKRGVKETSKLRIRSL